MIVAAVVRAGLGDVLRALLRRHVLEHDPQRREVAPQRRQVALDEDRLAIEHVDRRIGDLAVDEQDDAFLLGGGERRRDVAQVGDAGVAVASSRRPGRA